MSSVTGFQCIKYIWFSFTILSNSVYWKILKKKLNLSVIILRLWEFISIFVMGLSVSWRPFTPPTAPADSSKFDLRLYITHSAKSICNIFLFPSTPNNGFTEYEILLYTTDNADGIEVGSYFFVQLDCCSVELDFCNWIKSLQVAFQWKCYLKFAIVNKWREREQVLFV